MSSASPRDQPAPGWELGNDADTDPVSIEVNVDAALFLKDLVGIDSYPWVLALRPNIFLIAERNRVREVIRPQLAHAGILVDGKVHPVVEHWLECLYRPDVEMLARIADTGLEGEEADKGALRMSLVRRGTDHVLAIRNGDHVVIQSVFCRPGGFETVCEALLAALGPSPALNFAPMTATLEQFAEVPPGQERRRALQELGAQAHTAAVLSRAIDQVMRRTEVAMIEHHDGAETIPEIVLTVQDTLSGRIVVTPRAAMDGQIRYTFAPGDDAAVLSGMRALVDLMPGHSWFDTSRSD
ncbi:ESX secretion-associated protein EspG [Nocardia sp. NEAU-G5]|uniref:ESX secretion-associated protein EspG n=1 Tax=Nocardia albiluteola TaxID=2842303 RepID=A0ABS6B947_9NOCA|nr:ESX secretion-associated protein EspG [Nocardia albiluteola]MBU3066830.1 ESX secretion-associated protein EspG [Nocardia albiluteola]